MLPNMSFSRFLAIILTTTFLFGQLSCAQQQEGKSKEQLKEEAALIERMKNASIPEIKDFVQKTLDAPLPDDFETPEHIIQAGNPNDGTRAINERYPEFFGKEGSEYLESIAAHPVRFQEMIRESRALRKYYSKTIYEE